MLLKFYKVVLILYFSELFPFSYSSNTPAKKVLVLVPINTLQNWLNEFNMWVPENPDANSSNATCSKNVSTTSGSTNSDINKGNATFNEDSGQNSSIANSEINNASCSKSPYPTDNFVNQQVNNSDSNSRKGPCQEAISGIQQASNGSTNGFKINDSGQSMGDSAPKASEIHGTDSCIESENSIVNTYENKMEKDGTFEARELNHSDKKQGVSTDPKCEIVSDGLDEVESKDKEPKVNIKANGKSTGYRGDETEYRDYKVFIVNDSLKSTIARSKVVGKVLLCILEMT